MLTDQQISHFQAFGLLILRGAFSNAETGELIAETERLYRRVLGREPQEDEVIWEAGFVERSQQLMGLIDDERIHEAACDLIGDRFLWVGSEGMRGVDRNGPVHHWHTDGDKSRVKLTSRRLKIMLYLDPLTREEGALRVIPGSHRSPLFDILLPFQEEHTKEHPLFFGLQGQDIPGCAVETAPGDIAIVNPWIFHSVYGKVGRRRTIVLKFAGRPRTEAELKELKQSPGIFHPHRALLESRGPRIRRMVDGLAALEKRVAAV